jgi:hypothetical protein
MDEAAARGLQARLEQLIRERWSVLDPEVVVSSRLREGMKIDITVISRSFEGKDDLERSASFWPVFEPVPRSELIYMTYCLLLTPEEAADYFTAP